MDIIKFVPFHKKGKDSANKKGGRRTTVYSVTKPCGERISRSDRRKNFWTIFGKFARKRLFRTIVQVLKIFGAIIYAIQFLNRK